MADPFENNGDEFFDDGYAFDVFDTNKKETTLHEDMSTFIP